jgi:flagellar FliL protein
MAVSAVKSEPAAAEAAPQPAGKKGIIKLAIIGLLVAGLAGGGAWWFLGHKGGDAAKEAKHEPVKPPVFYALETFTVNLVLVDNPQFLQTGITLKVASEQVVEELKQHMPVVRDRILMLMSSRKAADLLTIEGKRQLGEEIVTSMNQILGGTAKARAAKAPAGKDAKDEKAADEDEDEKAADEGKDAKDAKAAKGGKDAEGGERPVKEVLFTSFIIQ